MYNFVHEADIAGLKITVKIVKIIQEKEKPIHRLDITANVRRTKWDVLMILVNHRMGVSRSCNYSKLSLC